MNSLPLFIYTAVQHRRSRLAISRAYGAASVLLDDGAGAVRVRPGPPRDKAVRR